MISLLVVNYRSAELARTAIRTARASSSQRLQVVAVDNSLDPAEADGLRDVADVVIVSETNSGYAGGINRGRRACTGDIIIVTNPDVVFAAQAIDHLAAELRTASIAGPALFWDDDHRWMLPPADRNSGWEKIDELLAARSIAWAKERDRRRFRQRVAFWSATEPRDVRALSGAVLAFRAADFDALGGFDERFPLYFEETDFLRRAAERHMRIRYVPAAKCRHLYNQSAGQVAADAAASYGISEQRYLEKWNGPFAARFLARMARPPRVWPAQPLAGPLVLDRDNVVVEASPLPGFATAAGHFPASRTVDLPPEVRDSLRDGVLYLRTVVRTTGEVLATYARYRS
jgi:GT2 family glycosyltransferase